MLIISTAASGQQSFEVVSVKPVAERRPVSMIFNGATVTMNSFPAAALIQQAYAVRPADIVNLPDWTKTEAFDVTAKTEDRFAATGPLSMERLRPLLQTLLADRFRFASHRETRELPVYELVLGKAGSKLKQSSGGDQEMSGCGRIQGVNQDGATLARQLALFAGRNVIDRTGLTDNYDYLLEWSPDLDASPDATGSNAPSLFTAIQEQLGLQLRPVRGPVQVLVVDTIERPSPN